MTESGRPEHRRHRRGFALLALSAALVLVVALTASATTWVLHRHAARTQLAAEDGAGFAPVLASPPADTTAPTPDSTFGVAPQLSTPGVARSGSRASETTSAQDAQVTATATATAPARGHGLQLILTSTLSDSLRPGSPRTLHVTVRNPDSVAVQLYRLDVRVGQPPVAGCLPAWVRTGRYRYAGGPKQMVPAQASVTVDLPIELVNLTAVDQNACQGTTFPLTLSGLGIGTP